MLDGGFSFRVGPTHHRLENSHIFIEQNYRLKNKNKNKKVGNKKAEEWVGEGEIGKKREEGGWLF